MEILGLLRTAMWIIASATFIVTVGLGMVLSYHWTKFGGNARVTSLTVVVYSLVSLVLLGMLFGSIPL